MQRKPSAFLRACEYLDGVTAEERRRGGGRLPSVAMLSKDAGVSRGVMLKALHHAASKGLIAVKPRSGFEIACESTADRALLRRNETWRFVASLLQRDLLEGRFSGGSALPSVKELASLYGVNYRTLRKRRSTGAHPRVCCRYATAG